MYDSALGQIIWVVSKGLWSNQCHIQLSHNTRLMSCFWNVTHSHHTQNKEILFVYLLHCKLSIRKCVDSTSRLFTTRIEPPSWPASHLGFLLPLFLSACLSDPSNFFYLCLISFLLLKALSFPSGDDEIHFDALSLAETAYSTHSTMASPLESGIYSLTWCRVLHLPISNRQNRHT